MWKNFTGLVLLILLFSGCKDNEAQLNIDSLKKKDTIYTDLYRPQFHFTPKEKWMNDPNGLVYNDGLYHLFYQFYPDSTVWGPMHWGHAVSKDLLHWKHRPIALKPDSLGYIFSGSAVVDKNNTSGFGSVNKPPMVSIFTYHNMEGERSGRLDYQTQGIAYSLDNGISWTKYQNNPVIKNDSIKDFRDPKVFWHEGSNKWILTLVAGDHAQFYNSDNLKDWKLTGEFGKQFGAHGGVWECPDLFKLPVEGTNEEKWVLLISINPGAPNGGSGTQYFIGNFDGKTFTPDHLDTRWIDYGTDNYAGVTYNHAPNENRVFIGWMSNWDYAQETPTKKWRSAMTLPRKLSLYKDGAETWLRNYPINQVDALLTEEIDTPSDLSKPILLRTNKRNGADITFEVDLTKPFSLRLSDRARNEFIFTSDPSKNSFSVNRSNSGKTDFNEKFVKLQTQSFEPIENFVEFRMIVDASSVEIFIDKGRYVFTDLVFPSETYSRLFINTKHEDAFQDLQIHTIKSVWTDEK